MLRTQGLVVAPFVLMLAAGAAAQRISVPVARLASPVDSTRINAFYGMVAEVSRVSTHGVSVKRGPRTDLLVEQAKNQDDLKLALISLLERENALMSRMAPGSMPAEYGSGYYADVFVTVARLNDPRSLNALMYVIEAGDLITSTVAGFGEVSVEPLIETLGGPDALKRSGAARALGTVSARRKQLQITDRALESIRKALLAALAKPDDFILRKNALEALWNYAEDDVRAAVQRVSESDTYVINRGNQSVYPIRDRARAWLAAHH